MIAVYDRDKNQRGWVAFPSRDAPPDYISWHNGTYQLRRLHHDGGSNPTSCHYAELEVVAA